MHATYNLAGGPFYKYFFRLLESETLVFLFLFLFLLLFFLEGGGGIFTKVLYWELHLHSISWNTV